MHIRRTGDEMQPEPNFTVNGHPGVENSIVSYFHCRRCMVSTVPPKIAVGITVDGDIQIWCENHNINIMLVELVEDES